MGRKKFFSQKKGTRGQNARSIPSGSSDNSSAASRTRWKAKRHKGGWPPRTARPQLPSVGAVLAEAMAVAERQHVERAEQQAAAAAARNRRAEARGVGGVLPYLAQQEDVKQLGMPATGVETRWAFYVDVAAWWEPMGRLEPLPSDVDDEYAGTCTGRLDRVINYFIDQAEKRTYTGESDSLLAERINAIASTELREVCALPLYTHAHADAHARMQTH